MLHLVLLSISDPSQEALDRMCDALQDDDAPAVEHFLCKPHDPNQEILGVTCLCLAARYGSLSAAKLMLEAGALLDKSLSPAGDRPLRAACSGGHVEFTRWLLQSRADIRKAEANHRWPLLTLACSHGHVEITRVFLEAGVDPDAEEADGGFTALMVSAVLQNLQLVQLLLTSGVDVNRESSRGHTALDLACFRGRLDAARLLLQHHADPSLRSQGQTAMDLAHIGGHPDVISLLVDSESRPPKRRRRMKGPP